MAMTKPDRPTVRLFVEEELYQGRCLALAEAPSHYLRNVMRKTEGTVIGVFNGTSAEFAATIVKVGKKGVEVEIGEPVLPFRALPPLTLLFSPIKRTPMEWVLAKATELGVTAFQPVLMEHTQSERLKVDRLRSIVIEAAEQCERLTVPTLFEPVAIQAAVEGFEGRLGAAVETSAFQPVASALAPIDTLEGLLVGPEGGFSPAEVSWIEKQDQIIGMGLGPRILKAETAALSILSVYQALKGDWVQRPDFRGTK